MVQTHNGFHYAVKSKSKNIFKIQIYYILLHFFKNSLNKQCSIVRFSVS